MLYSHNNQYPKTLPFRIRLSNGLTRTDPSTFTPEEITDAGYVAVSNPPVPTSTQVLSWTGTEWNLRDKTEAELFNDALKIKNDIIKKTQNRLDSFAQTRDYDNIVSACSYASSTHPKYGMEGQYCVQLRQDTWDVLYSIMADVESGVRPMPSGYDDIRDELPAPLWPDTVI